MRYSGCMLNWIQTVRKQPEFLYSVWSLCGQGAVSVAALGLTYVLANYVEKSVVGEYRLIISLYASISIFTLVGTTTALMRSVAAGHEQTFPYAFGIKLRYGLLGTAVFIPLVAYYGLTDNSSLAFGLLIAAFCMPLIEAASLFNSYLKGRSLFATAAIATAFQRLVVAAGVILAVFVQAELLYITVAYFVLQTIVSTFLYWRTVRQVSPTSDVDQAMLPYAKHLTAMSALGAISGQLDKYVLFIFFGPVALASYWIASVIPQEVGRVVSVVVSTVFPRMVKVGEARSTKLVRWLK